VVLGRRLAGRYALLSMLGRGGFGAVYAARDELLGRTVAIKVINAGAGEELRARFLREAKVMAMVKHPNIVAVFDVGWDGDDAFVAMEHLSGPDLDNVLSSAGRLPVPDALGYGVLVADALTWLHHQPTPIVHRDLKPSNLVLDGDGTVKVCDFGIAAVLDDALTRLTQPGVVLGSLSYMAPEQCEGNQATTATDIYAFGAVLYALLAGAPPISAGDGFLAYAWRVRTEEPQPLTDWCPDVPAELAELVHAMLAKEPAARPLAKTVHQRLRGIGTDPHAVALRAGELLLEQGRFAEAKQHFNALTRSLRASGLGDAPPAIAAEFGRIRGKYGAGEDQAAALALVRLAARARRVLDPHSELLRDIGAYLRLKSR
jgi:serine/threonine protein kinase